MDRRDRNHKWYSSFDAQRMTIMLDGANKDGSDAVLPAVYRVCETCEGRGKHVNPSIDAHGITPDEFDEDPDFRDDYFSGRYDVSCVECHGQRVVPEVADHATDEEKAIADSWYRGLREMEDEYEAERRMGA